MLFYWLYILRHGPCYSHETIWYCRIVLVSGKIFLSILQPCISVPQGVDSYPRVDLDKEDDLMADKMEPVLNPEYPETTETCIGSSSFLISISCTMLVRLMDDGWLAARHDLGHCLTAAVACCSRKPPAEDGWQGSCLSNVDQMRRW
nr:uncharacterized protein LOC127308246 isoform X4 [Lolium perenne]XP_051194994.1 uncharacterized protein LOC127308248 isoform X2 [Lolium perenne]